MWTGTPISEKPVCDCLGTGPSAEQGCHSWEEFYRTGLWHLLKPSVLAPVPQWPTWAQQIHILNSLQTGFLVIDFHTGLPRGNSRTTLLKSWLKLEIMAQGEANEINGYSHPAVEKWDTTHGCNSEVSTDVTSECVMERSPWMLLFRWVWTGEIDFTSCLPFGLGQSYLFIINVFSLPLNFLKTTSCIFWAEKK